MLITNALRYELNFFINQSKSFKIRCELSGLKPAHFVPLVSIFVRFFWWVYWKSVAIVYPYPVLTYVMLVEMTYVL